MCGDWLHCDRRGEDAPFATLKRHERRLRVIDGKAWWQKLVIQRGRGGEDAVQGVLVVAVEVCRVLRTERSRVLGVFDPGARTAVKTSDAGHGGEMRLCGAGARSGDGRNAR
jgi:hypothetical protein